ncbi:putative small secreted protein [Tahibacter aquaticus]|jgi:predicted small secreted protein|uniref:Putative small secreted protein n=1 Tax=Tahibacter aquaticus TaxID=520092 RepID=A0A4R6Z7D5_9GAMM|nr:entericidin A/B family lipoprotein [Tahibacter aquaticus]TDR47634.1 putative small secreted protein [Tahibacter aquaticus]
MKTSLKTISLLLALVLSAASLSACHTVKGAGKDIERAGEEIQKASDDVRK